MLGVFPLNIVVLPNESVALHLFEPRYRELFHDHRNGKEFVILFANKNERSSYGTTVFIDKIINEFPDGTVDVIVKGKSVVKILQFLNHFQDKLYSGVEVEHNYVDGPVSKKLCSLFKQHREVSGKKFHEEREYQLFEIARSIKLAQEVKNDLIMLGSPQEIDTFLINEIRFQLKIKEQEDQLNNNYHLN